MWYGHLFQVFNSESFLFLNNIMLGEFPKKNLSNFVANCMNIEDTVGDTNGP